MQQCASLSAANLSGGRSGRLVLAGVDLELQPGDVMVLRGANGAGKTTLLRTLAGLIPPLTGSATIQGQTDLTAPALCFLGHENGVKTAMTVRENLAFWRTLYGADTQDIERAVTAVSLGDFFDRRAALLSAGQRRRVGLSRLIVSRAPIWLLDEPTASLDRHSAENFERLVETHCESGGSALIATHEPLSIANAQNVVLDVQSETAPRALPDHANGGDAL